MAKMMHNHTAGHGILQDGEHELSILYRQKLLEMQKVMAKLYDQYSDSNGLLRYSDLAAYNVGNKTITQLRQMLDDAFGMRATIIRNNLKRGTAEQYHDVLYQIEKHARAAKLNHDILSIDVSAEGAELDTFDDMLHQSLNTPGKGPDGNDLPTWDEIIKKRNAESLNIIKKAFQAPLSSDGITLEQHMKSIQNALSRDAGLMIRVQHTYGNKLVNQATTAAFESRYAERVKEALQQQGENMQIIWRHDDPKEPRQNHVDLDGTPADENGEWHTNGYSAKGPGQFGVPSEDINCKCYLEVQRIDLKTSKAITVSDDSGDEQPFIQKPEDIAKISKMSRDLSEILPVGPHENAQVMLTGLNVEQAKQVCDSLTQFKEMYPNMKIRSIRTAYYNKSIFPSEKSALITVSTGDGIPYIVINRDVILQNLTLNQTNAIFKSTKSTLCNSLHDAICHEVGHVLVDNWSVKLPRSETQALKYISIHISDQSEQDGEELIAEAFVAKLNNIKIDEKKWGKIKQIVLKFTGVEL